jgi:hypothetical protein
MGGDRSAAEAYPRATQTFVRGVTGVDVDGRPLAPSFVYVYGTLSKAPEGPPDLARDVGVVVGGEGVPDEAPFRTQLEELRDGRVGVSLTLHRSSAPPVIFRARISALAPPGGEGAVLFAAWIVGDTRFDTARVLGVEPENP